MRRRRGWFRPCWPGRDVSAGDDRFRIAIDPSEHLLRITLRGHWDLTAVTRYRAALADAVASMRAAGCAPGSIAALVDAREGGPQSQEVVAAWREQLATTVFVPRRLATIVSSALLKRQVDRIGVANQKLFDNEADAVAWLAAEAREQ